MKPLSLADIQAIQDKPNEKIEVPEWGGFVFIRRMSGKQHDDFDEWITGQDGKINTDLLREKVIVCTVCNEQGEPLFTNDHLTMLADKFSVPVRRLYEACCKLNKIRRIDLDEKKDDSATVPIDSSR